MPRTPIIRFLGTSGGAGTVTGTGALATGSATIAGTGTRTITGAGALVCAAAIVAGASFVGHVGSGSLAAQAATVSGAGVIAHVGTGALASSAATLSGEGSVSAPGTVTGEGALSSGASSLSGAGVLTRLGSGALASSAATVAGAGVLAHVGTGALAAGASALSGAGTAAASATCLTLATVITGTTTVQDLFEGLIDMLAAYTAARAAKLDNLDVAVSTRLAAADYVEADNTSITAIKVVTDQLTDTRLGLLDNLNYLDGRNMGPLLLRNPYGVPEVLTTREPKKP